MPTATGIEKNRRKRDYRQSSDDRKLVIARPPVAKAIKDVFKTQAPNFRLSKNAIGTIHMAMEQYAIDKMQISQTLTLSQGRYTVMHLAS